MMRLNKFGTYDSWQFKELLHIAEIPGIQTSAILLTSLMKAGLVIWADGIFSSNPEVCGSSGM
jgi:hypothetical protein